MKTIKIRAKNITRAILLWEQYAYRNGVLHKFPRMEGSAPIFEFTYLTNAQFMRECLDVR